MNLSRVVYRAAPGAPFNNKQAPAIGTRLMQLARSAGEPVPPQVVLDDARPEGSPLHPFFEWDDGEAAERWRLHQARQLVNHLQIIVVGSNGEEETRAMHNLVIETDAGESVRGYVTAKTIEADAGMRAKVIENAMNHLQQWKARYGQYSELYGVVEAIDAATAARKTKKGKKKSA